MLHVKENKSATADRELTISRLFNAPRELVWEVWTNPEHIKNWWGPNGFSNTIFKMDVKPGGEWDFIMHGPDGTDYKNKSIYKEIRKPEKIVFEHVSGPKFTATITFEKKENKTFLTWNMLFQTKEEFEQVVKTFKADEGLKQNIEKLDAYMGSLNFLNTLTITRNINAPRELVFKAWTDKNMLEKWWGPYGFTNPVCEIEVKAGGGIYIDMKGPDGTIYPMDGEFHEIIPNEKIVFTSAALDAEGKRLFEVMNTVTFHYEDGKTKLMLEAVVSKIKSEGLHHIDGMNEGWNQSLDRLINLVQ
ncbi:MAG: SRPBCC domain-containing protein [Sphingobacteriales bacterium]